MTRQWWYVVSLFLAVVLGAWWYRVWLDRHLIADPAGPPEKPYAKYSIERLVARVDRPSAIERNQDKFYYQSEGRRISGMTLQPEGEPKGVVVMARGYVEKEGYQIGTGTKNAAKYFASQGYVTYAPDFSGYGESDPEDSNALGVRLVKPVEILDLIASVSKPSMPIYLWGHSNGGQIMLTVAEVLGKRGDTRVRGVILWAPVSKPFPYNILYYTDEADDQGKWLRGEIAKFEADYDAYDYSLDRYLDWINMPMQIHQGSADDAVPEKWSDELVVKLKEKEKEVNYYQYSGADHNLRPSWNTVVARDVEWMQQLTMGEK